MAITSNYTETMPAKRAFHILHLGFIAAPILMGADKFLNLLTNWEAYVSPAIAKLIAPSTFLMIVGVIEIVAGIVVAVAPRFGGYLVAAWLGGIILNLLTIPGHLDVALRDFGLLLGALALAQLAQQFHGGGHRA
jgi:hypothetical protein